jgi:hypothetical protein
MNPNEKLAGTRNNSSKSPDRAGVAGAASASSVSVRSPSGPPGSANAPYATAIARAVAGHDGAHCAAQLAALAEVGDERIADGLEAGRDHPVDVPTMQTPSLR